MLLCGDFSSGGAPLFFSTSSFGGGTCGGGGGGGGCGGLNVLNSGGLHFSSIIASTTSTSSSLCSPYRNLFALVQSMAAISTANNNNNNNNYNTNINNNIINQEEVEEEEEEEEEEDIFLENGSMSYENPNYHLNPTNHHINQIYNNNNNNMMYDLDIYRELDNLDLSTTKHNLTNIIQNNNNNNSNNSNNGRKNYANLDMHRMGVDINTTDNKDDDLIKKGGKINESDVNDDDDAAAIYALPMKLKKISSIDGDIYASDDKESENNDLPPGWEKHEDNDGPYYWHIKSGTIQREVPNLPEQQSVDNKTNNNTNADILMMVFEGGNGGGVVAAATATATAVTRSNTSSALDFEAEERKQRKNDISLKRRSYPLKQENDLLSINNTSSTTVGSASKEPQTTVSSGSASAIYNTRCIRFAVRSLGWVEICEDDLTPERSSKAVNKCIVDLSVGKGGDILDVVGRWGDGKDLFMDLDEGSLKLIDPENLTILNTQPIHTIRVWGVGRDNGRDFAYVARDRSTRKHMCHVFRCDMPARTIANTLRDICKKIMIERSLHQQQQQFSTHNQQIEQQQQQQQQQQNSDPQPQQQQNNTQTTTQAAIRPTNLPLVTTERQSRRLSSSSSTTIRQNNCQSSTSSNNNCHQNGGSGGGGGVGSKMAASASSASGFNYYYQLTSSSQSTTISFPTPMEEPKKVLKAQYLGTTQVTCATGMDTINQAIDKVVGGDGGDGGLPMDRWQFVNVSVAPSMISINSATDDKLLAECRVRYLSFLGIGKLIKHSAFIMHTSQDTYVAHVFYCEPSSGALCKTIEAACKLRYQKCLDAHPQNGGAVEGNKNAVNCLQMTPGGKNTISTTLKSIVGSLTGKKTKKSF